MMDYMYKGETTCPEEQIGQLIKSAENLQIRGLTNDRQLMASQVPFPASRPSYSPARYGQQESAGPSSGPNTESPLSKPPPHISTNNPGSSHSSQSSPVSMTHGNMG